MLSLSQNSASLPVTKAKVKVHTTPDEDVGGSGEAPAEDEPPVQKELPPSSEIPQENVSAPKLFREEQITFEHIMKTFGLDKPPKNLPCPYVCFIFYFPFLEKYLIYFLKSKFQNYRNLFF